MCAAEQSGKRAEAGQKTKARNKRRAKCDENVVTEQLMACNGYKTLKYVTDFQRTPIPMCPSVCVCVLLLYKNNFPLTSVTLSRFAVVIVVPQAEHFVCGI